MNEDYTADDLVNALIRQREMFANESAKLTAMVAHLERRVDALAAETATEDADA